MKTLLLLLSTLLLSPAYGSGDHNHEASVEAAPHGGILRDALPFKAELVLNKDNARIFLYDKELKAVAKEKLPATIKGQLAFPKDKKKKEVTFNLKGDAYESKLAGISKVHRYDLHVNVTIEGKPVVLDFGVDNIH